MTDCTGVSATEVSATDTPGDYYVFPKVKARLCHVITAFGNVLLKGEFAMATYGQESSMAISRPGRCFSAYNICIHSLFMDSWLAGTGQMSTSERVGRYPCFEQGQYASRACRRSRLIVSGRLRLCTDEPRTIYSGTNDYVLP